MSTTGQRNVVFGGSAVVVEYAGEMAARVVDFVYRYISPLNHVSPHMIYRVVEKEGQLAVHRDDELLYAGDSKGAAADWLMGDSCHQLVERSRGGLLFHAAVLTRPGCSLILPGTIGVGKSTLAAWLAARGWTYLTDEMVYVAHAASVSPEGDGLDAFTRPLNLKTPSRQPLKGLFDFDRPSEHILPTPQGVLLSPALLNASPPNGHCERAQPSKHSPILFIFPHYVPGGEFELGPLSPAQAGLALMECLVNARNLPDHGFAQAARLARQLPGYTLRYGHFEQIGEQIEALQK